MEKIVFKIFLYESVSNYLRINYVLRDTRNIATISN